MREQRLAHPRRRPRREEYADRREQCQQKNALDRRAQSNRSVTPEPQSVAERAKTKMRHSGFPLRGDMPELRVPLEEPLRTLLAGYQPRSRSDNHTPEPHASSTFRDPANFASSG